MSEAPETDEVSGPDTVHIIFRKRDMPLVFTPEIAPKGTIEYLRADVARQEIERLKCPDCGETRGICVKCNPDITADLAAARREIEEYKDIRILLMQALACATERPHTRKEVVKDTLMAEGPVTLACDYQNKVVKPLRVEIARLEHALRAHTGARCRLDAATRVSGRAWSRCSRCTGARCRLDAATKAGKVHWFFTSEMYRRALPPRRSDSFGLLLCALMEIMYRRALPPRRSDRALATRRGQKPKMYRRALPPRRSDSP